jgi:hypothetical protein
VSRPLHRDNLFKVSELIGRPMSVDPSRPNLDGGATSFTTPPDYPVYRVVKSCPACKGSFYGNSFAPQYDDDPPREGLCDGCIDRRMSRSGPVDWKAEEWSRRPVSLPELQPPAEVGVE